MHVYMGFKASGASRSDFRQHIREPGQVAEWIAEALNWLLRLAIGLHLDSQKARL